MKLEIAMFSRDRRSRSLFRKSWEIAALNIGSELKVFCRNFGVFNLLRSLVNFVYKMNSKRVVFGATEILIYAIFSDRKDVWVFTGLGRLFLKDGYVSKLVKLYLRILHKGQLIIVLNREDCDAIRCFIACEPIVLEGEGYPFNGSYKERARKKPSPNIVFAYVGRVLKSKGVDKLVEAFSVASKKEWTLLIVGDTDYSNIDSVPQDVLKNCAEQSVGKIIYTGFTHDVSSVLDHVDVLVSMSKREGLPFAILDGVAAGVHLILSPVPGHLSFAGLPGVTFVDPDNLLTMFDDFSQGHLTIDFDGLSRFVECKRKFGRDTIVKEIEQILIS